MRKRIIFGNWKMNTSLKEALELTREIKRKLSDVSNIEIGICPPYVYLKDIFEVVKYSNIKLGAQDVFYENKGAFTGEISPEMLKDVGCEYAIIGHSERRIIIGENDFLINKKINCAIESGLNVIFCVGETLEEREKNITQEVVRRQFAEGLKNISAEKMKNIVIAYEPVWAIGTGKTATPLQAQEVHFFIRNLLREFYGIDTADSTRIQYGGSVKPENIKDIINQPDVDGALVGGASLSADSFSQIILNSINY